MRESNTFLEDGSFMGECGAKHRGGGSAVPIAVEDSGAKGELSTHSAGTSEAANEQGFHTSFPTAK